MMCPNCGCRLVRTQDGIWYICFNCDEEFRREV